MVSDSHFLHKCVPKRLNHATYQRAGRRPMVATCKQQDRNVLLLKTGTRISKRTLNVPTLAGAAEKAQQSQTHLMEEKAELQVPLRHEAERNSG